MTLHPLLHPALAATVYRQRHAELEREAAGFRAAAESENPNRIERLFVRRCEGNATWIETVLVKHAA